MSEVKRGDIYLCDLGTGIGSEQGGVRPVLIVQNDIGNKHSPTTIVAIITSKRKHHLPTHVFVNEPLKVPSTILCEQLFTIDKTRLVKNVGTLDDTILKQVNNALFISVQI